MAPCDPAEAEKLRHRALCARHFAPRQCFRQVPLARRGFGPAAESTSPPFAPPHRMPADEPFFSHHAHGIHVIDTGFHRPRFDASFLIVEAGRAAFVDTGTNHSVPRLLATLDALGIARDAVDWVI